MIVPRRFTPIPCSAIPEALDDGHRRFRGCSISDDAYAIAGAQLELEHGRRIVSAADVVRVPEARSLLGAEVLWGVWGTNLGNHDATADDRDDPTIPIFQTVPEGELGPTGTYKAQHWRRAYEDIGAGCEGYWRCLYFGFGDAYEAMRSGDIDGFVHDLKLANYFTAREAQYDQIEEALVAGWRKRIAAASA